MKWTGSIIKMAARALQRSFKLFQVCSRRFIRTEASVKCSANIKCSQLRKRGLLRVGGRDSINFLQGLVTNDVKSFYSDAERKAMYAMFLNASGRTLYDVVFYKLEANGETPVFAVECDSSAITDLMKHLKMFKLRAKVDISESVDYEPWVLFSPSGCVELTDPSSGSDILVLVKDPRIDELGYRVVSPKGSSPCVCFEDIYETGDTFEYDIHRAKLGICEGVDEIPPGNTLPLEYNIAYLNGVSFSKGCYLGQELIARTHHTGVIRKRTVPLKILDPKSEQGQFEPGTRVRNSQGKAAGKVCAIYGQYGVGVMRLEMLKQDNQLFIKTKNGEEVEVTASIPQWWPKEGHDSS